MKINIGIVATAATKKPSDKSVKKAAAVLKQATKAKADAIKEKLQAAIDKALALDSESKDNHAVFEAQISKLAGQIKKLETKRDNAKAKAEDRISKLVPRITKLQDEYHLVGGKDIVPQALAEYFTAAPADSSKKPKAGSLGKGVKELKGDGKKTGKVIDKLTGKKAKKRPQA